MTQPVPPGDAPGEAEEPRQTVSMMPITFELGGVDNPNDPRKAILSRPLFVPVAQQKALPVITEAPRGEIGRALAAGRICSACRYFEYERGPAKFTRERLWQGVVRELAHNPEWWNPTDYGMCGLETRTATHKDATCEAFVPKSRLVSFLGKLTSR